MKKVISLSSDFGVQSQGVAMMEATVLSINPEVKVIHLMHGLPSFSLHYAARTMETLHYFPVGYHICVVDPGVGTSRKPIIILTKRGDYLIGPDNGVLMSGARFLGGIKSVVEITNKRYMRKPVSPIFHGRDIFSPAAAFLSRGVSISEFGPSINPKDLESAPYEEAEVDDGLIAAEIISINKFGSLHLNVTWKEWDKLNVKLKQEVTVECKGTTLQIPYVQTFGEVQKGADLIFKDEYGRMEIALNQASFEKKHGVKIGERISIFKNTK